MSTYAPCESQAKPLPAPASYGLVLIGNIQQQHQRCDDNNNKTMSCFSQGTGASDGHPSPPQTLLASRISPWGVREQPWGLVEVEQILEVDHRFPLGSSRLFSSPSSLSYERRTLWEELRRRSHCPRWCDDPPVQPWTWLQEENITRTTITKIPHAHTPVLPTFFYQNPKYLEKS